MEKKKKMQPKFHIRSGDTVKVISGNSKGKTGKVVTMLIDKERAIVEGANMVTKHMKPNAENPQGSIEKREAGIHLSNLMLVDPATGEATRTGRRKNENGKLQRFSKKTDKFI